VAVANVANVVLELIFVYAAHWGVRGSAWGTVLAQVVAGAWFGVLVTRRVRQRGGRLHPNAGEMARLISGGRRLTMRTLAIAGAFVVATSVAARVGPSTLAAHQIAMQVFLFLALSVDALAVAAQAMVGTSLGAGESGDAQAIGGRVLRLGMLVGAGLGLVLLVTSPLLPSAFTADHAVGSRATVALAFLALLQVPAAAAFALDGVLMGASDYGFLQWASLASLALLLPWMGVIVRWPSLGIAGLWSGLAVWMVVRAISNITRCRRLA
jgi:putative MATE family efflux protein